LYRLFCFGAVQQAMPAFILWAITDHVGAEMDINGPLKIGVIDAPDSPGWELQVSFTDEFKKSSLEDQGRIFQAYVEELVEGINALPEGDRNRDGMAIVYQLCSQMLPYIKEGQIALEESMMVEIGRNQAVSITDFLNG
jgi:hypothetical protein